MPFPDSPRIIYDKNPLETVLCQLRFPPILKIETGALAAFQERVRKEYPLFDERPAVDLGPSLPPEIAKLMSADLPFILRGGSLYEFSTSDASWKITLTRDFLALTAGRYERWEVFWDRLEFALNALLLEFCPAFFTRIGLRYRNVIQRSVLNLQDSNWGHLLQPHIAGELASREIAGAVVKASRDIVINLEAGAQVRIQHGVAPVGDTREVYLIDSDFFVAARTEVGDAKRKLDYFNREAGRLFRWCIQDKLHQAMGPRPI